MKRSAALLVIPAVAGSMTLTACGGSSGSTSSSAATAAASSSSAASSTGTTATASDSSSASACPTSSTRAFAKTRFVADIGLAAGTFHRYIYKPYQAGTFKNGASGRTLAMVKAGATAALDIHLVNNAIDNVKADPTLCRALGTPLTKLKDTLDSVKSGVLSGDLSTIATAESVMSNVMGTSQQNGMKITETTDENAVTQ